MDITIASPAGPRTGVIPFEGIANEIALLKSLILTLALERRLGAEEVSITLDLHDADPERLIAIARTFSQMLRDGEAPQIAPAALPTYSPGKLLPEARRASELLHALEAHIHNGGSPLQGYREAARLIKWHTSIFLPVGQICSRIDLAAHDAGLPMLALNWVRRPDGSINRNAFPPPCVESEQEHIDRMVNYPWHGEHFDLLRAHLDRLPPNMSAARLWQERERKSAGSPVLGGAPVASFPVGSGRHEERPSS